MPDLNSQFFVQVISIDNIFRSKNLEPSLTKLGLKLQISPGVVPNEIDFRAGLLHSAFIYKLLSQRKGTIGEIGAALAHRVAMNSFLNSNHKFGIIFEDDAEVISGFNFDVLADLLDSDLPVVIALGWHSGFTISRNPQILPSEEIIELITAPNGSFAYALNRPAADFIIGSHYKIIDTVDWPVYTLNKVKFYATRSPWISTEDDPQFSTIGVRSRPIPKSPIGVLLSRMKLLTYLLVLLLLSKTKFLVASPKQIVHQVVIRGLLQKYGVSQVVEKSTSNQVVPLPLKFHRMLNLLKLN